MFRSWFTTAHSQKYTGSLYLFPQSEGNFRGTRYYLISVFSTALVVAGLLPLDKIFKNPCMFQLLHLHTILTNVLRADFALFPTPTFSAHSPNQFFFYRMRESTTFICTSQNGSLFINHPMRRRHIMASLSGCCTTNTEISK